MSLIAKGYSNKEISKQLFISEGTVANYITSILGKNWSRASDTNRDLFYYRKSRLIWKIGSF